MSDEFRLMRWSARDRDALHDVAAALRASSGAVDSASLPRFAPPEEPTEVERARAVLRQRRTRAAAFASVRKLFHDPAWEIMLAMFIAQEEGESLTVEDIGAAVGLPGATVRRWLLALEQQALIHCWPRDQAPATRFAGLTDSANAMMLRFLDAT